MMCKYCKLIAYHPSYILIHKTEDCAIVLNPRECELSESQKQFANDMVEKMYKTDIIIHKCWGTAFPEKAKNTEIVKFHNKKT